MKWLQGWGEGVDVIPHEQKVFVDDRPETPEPENAFSDSVPGEYVFRLYLGLSAARDLISGLRDYSKTAYWVQTSIGAADAHGTYAGASSHESDRLDTAILSSISLLLAGPRNSLRDFIDRYEARHGQAPRDPTLTASLLSPGSVSPEPGDRNAWVVARAVDCRGRTHDRTFFYYQRRLPRGTVVARNAKEDYAFTASGDWGIAESQITGSVDLRYTLEKGTEAGSEPMEVFVIARGNRHVRQVVFIKIKGLLLEVKPQRRFLWPGQQTSVRVRLWKTSDGEEREPLGPRRVRVMMQGLRDGSLAPAGPVMTNAEGEATLTYTAGRSAGAVKVVCTYEPDGYKEHVTGEATITVVSEEAEGGVGEYEHITTRETRGPDGYFSDYKKVTTGTVRLGPFDGKYRFPCTASVQVHMSHTNNSDLGKGMPPPAWRSTRYYDTEASGEVDCVLEYEWPRGDHYSFVTKGSVRGRSVETSIDPQRPIHGEPLVITRTHDTNESPGAAGIGSGSEYRVEPGTLRLEGVRDRPGEEGCTKWRSTLRWSFRLKPPRGK